MVLVAVVLVIWHDGVMVMSYFIFECIIIVLERLYYKTKDTVRSEVFLDENEFRTSRTRTSLYSST